MKTWLVALIALAPLAAFAQSSEEDRIRQIKIGVNQRMTQQADIWFEDGEFPKITQAYWVRAELYPDYEEAWTDLIYMLFSTEQREKELAVAIRFKELNLKSADAYFPEANIYNRTKAYAKAIPLLEKSISITPPPHSNSYRLLASCYKRLGRLEAAIKTYKEMLKVYPDDKAAIANLKNAEDELKRKTGGG